MLEKNMQRIQLSWVENNINHSFKPEEYDDLFNYHKFSKWPFDYNAIIGWSDQDMFHGYIEGFYKAAEKLARNYQGEVDYLVYPVIFNYRQYLELALKKILPLLQVYFGEPIPVGTQNHNINKYLVDICKILDEKLVGHFIPFKIRNAINSIYLLDEKNDKYRFAYDQKGNLSHKYDDTTINLLQFANGMYEIHEYLDLLIIYLEEEGREECSLLDTHTMNFIQQLVGLNKQSHLNPKDELGKLNYQFDHLPAEPNNPFRREKDDRSLFIIKDSIEKNPTDMDGSTICQIGFSMDGDEYAIANIRFFHGENNKLKYFTVTQS